MSTAGVAHSAECPPTPKCGGKAWEGLGGKGEGPRAAPDSK